MNGYTALASYYDRLMSVDYDERAAYLESLFSRHGATVHTLLDLACGSGSLTAALAAKGYDMIGVDSSEDMLCCAMEKSPNSMWLCQDMRALDLYDVVDGAVCTLDSLNHLLKTSDILAVLERLRLFIAPGGLFIFDVNTPYKHRNVLGDNTFVFEEEDLLCVWQNQFREQTCTVHMDLDFFEEDEDGRYIRTSDRVTERAYTLSTWKRMLEQAGFQCLAVYDDLTVAPPSDLSERLVIVAQNTRPTEDYSV